MVVVLRQSEHPSTLPPHLHQREVQVCDIWGGSVRDSIHCSCVLRKRMGAVRTFSQPMLMILGF